MHCPFGYEVGDPPELTRCPLGFPGCGCGDVIVLGVENPEDPEDEERYDTIMTWWSKNAIDWDEDTTDEPDS